MTIPKTNYVLDNQGRKIAVQLSLKDWERFVAEYQRIEQMLSFKNKLKEACREVEQIRKGEKKGVTLSEFLNEL